MLYPQKKHTLHSAAGMLGKYGDKEEIGKYRGFIIHIIKPKGRMEH